MTSRHFLIVFCASSKIVTPVLPFSGLRVYVQPGSIERQLTCEVWPMANLTADYRYATFSSWIGP